jgi:glycosyltransferase involved in cell wall biosynthesis
MRAASDCATSIDTGVHEQHKPGVADVSLIIPATDVSNPELSIVVPALDEEITIGGFVDWCKEGIAAAGVTAEILIIDSSSDRTAEIAVAHGARVLKTAKRGLGRAYIDAISHIRGRYVLMGDADCTYDFRDIRGFVEKFRAGYEFIMGSRFAGSIEKGAMPPLHRYFGNPLTTFLLNFVFGTKFEDIHCGMRGLTMDGLQRLGLTSQGWEYASEMIVKAHQIKLRTAQVPVRFLKDQKGRLSHLKRSGWITPWRAGWHTLKIILMYGSARVIQPISLVLSIPSILLLLILANGPVPIFGIRLSLYTMLLAMTCLIVGLTLSGISLLSICINDRVGYHIAYWNEKFSFTRSMIICLSLFALGFVLCSLFLIKYVLSTYIVTDDLVRLGHLSILGLTMIIASVLTAGFAIILQALVDRLRISESAQQTRL